MGVNRKTLEGLVWCFCYVLPASSACGHHNSFFNRKAFKNQIVVKGVRWLQVVFQVLTYIHIFQNNVFVSTYYHLLSLVCVWVLFIDLNLLAVFSHLLSSVVVLSVFSLYRFSNKYLLQDWKCDLKSHKASCLEWFMGIQFCGIINLQA